MLQRKFQINKIPKNIQKFDNLTSNLVTNLHAVANRHYLNDRQMPRRSSIRNLRKSATDTAQPLASQVSETAMAMNKSIKKRYFKSKKRVIRNGLVLTNVALLIAITGFVLASRPQASNSVRKPLLASATERVSDPLDTLSSADIAVNIAQLVQMDEATAVTNNADSVNTRLEVVPSDSQVVAKPQIVSTEIKSVKDIKTHVAVEGDTVSSLAEKYGVSQNAIKWSNDLASDAIAVGTELSIPPVEGFIYTVKEGDTAQTIADKYSSSAEKVIAFNDAEISGFVKDQKIVIPGGEIPAPVVRRIAGPAVSGFRFGSSAVYGYNGYDYGYCTWYASNRRAEVGRPIPANLGNASTWKSRSQLAGIPVGNVPLAGAVIWTPPRDYYGHVGFVEEVLPDGSVRVSEMNVRGWGVRSEKVLTPAQAAGYSYIY
jgi:surface antigen